MGRSNTSCRIFMRYILIFIMLIVGLPCFGVSATITVPSSDSLPQDVIMLKDVTLVSPFKGSVTTTPSVNIGTGHGTEFAIGVPVNIKFKDAYTTEKLLLETKKVFTQGNNRLTVGASVLPYLNKSTCPDGFFYLHITRIIEQTNTSITFGGYMTGTEQLVDSGGTLFVIEQALTDKLKLQSELLTGNNNRSNFAVGLKYKFNDMSISSAILVPNHCNNNVGFQIIVSKLISLQ